VFNATLQQGMMTILTEGRGMQPTCNSSYGITGIWELVTEGLFPVVVCGYAVLSLNNFILIIKDMNNYI
jgi:hypothetical protein